MICTTLVCDDKTVSLNKHCSVMSLPVSQQVIFYGGKRHKTEEPTADFFLFDFQACRFTPVLGRSSVLRTLKNDLLTSWKPHYKTTQHTAHFVDNKWMYLIGGYCNRNRQPSPVVRYHVFCQKWEKLTEKNYDVYSHSSVLNKDSTIIVLGGCQISASSALPQWVKQSMMQSTATSAILKLDLKSSKWSSIYESSSIDTLGHSSILYDNKIYVFGGMKPDAIVVNSLWCYDLITEILEPIFHSDHQSDTPLPRCFHTAVLFGDRMIIYGGYDKDRQIIQEHNLFSFEFATRTWNRMTLTTIDSKPDGYITSISNYISVNRSDLYLFNTYVKESTLFYQYRTLVYRLHFDSRDQILFKETLWHSILDCFPNSCLLVVTLI